jgi:hypothetical protein
MILNLNFLLLSLGLLFGLNFRNLKPLLALMILLDHGPLIVGGSVTHLLLLDLASSA